MKGSILAGFGITMLAGVVWASIVVLLVVGVFHVPVPWNTYITIPLSMLGGFVLGCIGFELTTQRMRGRYK